MGLLADLALTWRAPGRGAARRLATASEARALAWLAAALAISFAASLPGLAHAPRAPDDPPFVAEAAGRLLGGLLLAPLMFYALASLGWVLLRWIRGAGGRDGLAARAALFWAALAVSPVVLSRGAAAGLGAPPTALALLDLLAGAALLIFWAAGLAVAADGARGPARQR